MNQHNKRRRQRREDLKDLKTIILQSRERTPTKTFVYLPEKGQISENSWAAASVTVDEVPYLLFFLVNHMGPNDFRNNFYPTVRA